MSTQHSYRIGGFTNVMGMSLVSASVSEVVGELVVSEQHHQPWGIVHGGVYCAMIETACSIGAQAVVAQKGWGGFMVGLDNHTSFLKATRSGTLRISAKPLVASKRTQLWDATITNEAGEVVSTGRVRLMMVEAGKTLAGETVAKK
jgi:1,4-dihydroxy-2-naphthoyl-CoA hydrolase